MGTEPVLWYYTQGTERRGPITDDRLAQLVAIGEVTPDTLLWNLSLPGWVAARTIFTTPPPPPLPDRTAHVSVPLAQTATSVVQVTVKNVSVLLMIVLTIVTLGFYYNIWFLKRREELNNLRSQRKLGAAPIIIPLLAACISLLLRLFDADPALAGAFYLLDYGCLLFATVRVANMIDDHCRTMGQISNVRSGFAGCGVIFFGAYWLQHCINKYLPSPVGEGAKESLSFPRTMKTTTKVAIGLLGVFCILFIVIIIGVIAGKLGLLSSGSSTSVGDLSDLPIPVDEPQDLTLLSAMLQLRSGQHSINDLQRPCSYRGAPAFVVESIVDDFVIYKVDLGPEQADLKIAIEKVEGKYYGEGQGMSSSEHINIIGGQEFKTVLGATQMIPAGRYADSHQVHCH